MHMSCVDKYVMVSGGSTSLVNETASPVFLYTRIQTVVYTPYLSNRFGYLHATLYEYILGQDDVSRTRIVTPPVLVSELCPLIFFQNILVLAITQ